MNLRCIFRNLSNIYAGFLNEKKLLTFITKKLYRTGFNSSKDTSIFYRITVPKGFVKLKRKKSYTHADFQTICFLEKNFWNKFFWECPQETFHTPSARWSRETGMTCPYTKTQDYSNSRKILGIHQSYDRATKRCMLTF